MAGVALSFGIAVIGGVLAGFIASRSYFSEPSILFSDDDNFLDVKFPIINFKAKHETEE